MINNSVHRIIGVLDPTKVLCAECGEYKDIELFKDAKHFYSDCLDCYNKELTVLANVQKNYKMTIGSNDERVTNKDLDELVFGTERHMNSNTRFRTHIEEMPDNTMDILDFLLWLKTHHQWEIKSLSGVLPTGNRLRGFVDDYQKSKE